MRVITLNDNKTVISVKDVGDNYILQPNELQIDIGEIGEIMQEDGSFITPTPEPIIPKPSLEERMTQLQQDNLIVMDALATIYETILMGGTV